MDKREEVINAYNLLRSNGLAHSQNDFANLLGVNKASLSRAMNGDEKYLTATFMAKVQALIEERVSAIPTTWTRDFPALDGGISTSVEKATLPVIPTEALAGTLGEFADTITEYQCERITSPVKGADYAIKIYGDSMSPEYPSGSLILIKKVNENAFIEWGKVYCLDTCNGAVIKQIRKTDKEGEVECVSLNPAFQPFTINTSFINGWYRVLMVLSMK